MSRLLVDGYEVTIGIECHVQLATATKLFSGADNDARDKAPNMVVSPICFGLPGTLPVLNQRALELAVRVGLALNAAIAPLSRFERKHYFYPDLPKGYQITQLAEPTIGPGSVAITLPDGTVSTVRIHHAHIEEDAGKLVHPAGAAYSLVDLNRAGTPLIEIVSEADMHSPAAAKAYAQELYLLMTYACVTAGDLYHGNMRFDVNLSVALPGQPLGTRSETKNLNSFRSVERAADYEARRQVELLKSGGTVAQETRGWDDDKQLTFSQRDKEDAHDYRYFPDADLPPVRLSQQYIEEIREAMPALPSAYRQAWQPLQIGPSVVTALLGHQPFARLVSDVLAAGSADAAQRIAHLAAGYSPKENELPTEIASPPAAFVELAVLAEKGDISAASARSLFAVLLQEAAEPRVLAEARGLLQSNDEEAIVAIVRAVLADPASQKAISDIKAGNDKAIGYLVGQAMQRSKGAANPATIQRLVRRELGVLQ